MKVRFKNILSRTRKKNGSIVLICAVVLTVSLGALVGCSLPAATAGDNALPLFPAAIPQDGQIYGYLPKLENGIATIDRQLWLTPESEDWKPEYNDAAGFEVVDAEGGDITYPLHENCTFSILENHHDPRLELNAEEFLTALPDMEYPVLWIIQLENGQIMDISEQYRP